FFQAEDGIRDDLVTGVQTCALPIYKNRRLRRFPARKLPQPHRLKLQHHRIRRGPGKWLLFGRERRRRLRISEPLRVRVQRQSREIGRASCTERGERAMDGGW